MKFIPESLKIKILFYALMLSLVQSNFALAVQVNSVLQVGPHQRIFIVEKNQNPQNKLIVYTKLDADCNFIKDSANKPIFDFYWLMNGASYKPMNALLKSEVKKRLQFSFDSKINQNKSFYIIPSDLSMVKNDIADPRVIVTSLSKDGECEVQSFMRLGPSNQNALIRVESFYGESSGGFQPKNLAVTIKGFDAQTGKAIARTYKNN